MTQARKLFILIILGVIVLALSLTIFLRNRSLDDDLLAIVGIIGGIAIIINTLPSNGKEKHDI